jgi:hypothetical protein
MEYSWFSHYPVSVVVIIIVAEPDPWDPNVFGPPGSGTGSINQIYGSGYFLIFEK